MGGKYICEKRYTQLGYFLSSYVDVMYKLMNLINLHKYHKTIISIFYKEKNN